MKHLIFVCLLFVFAFGMNGQSFAQEDQGSTGLRGLRGKNQVPQMNNPAIMNNQQIGSEKTALSQEWPVEIVKSNLVGPWSRSGDFDNDGDQDLLIENGDTLFWYENQQSSWSEHIIGTEFYNAEYAWVEAFDLDQDGDLDVLQYPMINPSGMVWNENEMNGLQWEKHLIDNTVNQPFNWSKAYGDIDQDGDIDLAVSSGGDGSVMWFENVSGDTSWQKRVIANIGINALWTSLADMDGDNDLDIISATYSPGDIVWYENQLPNTTWMAHPITTLSGTAWGFCFDIDEDGDQDIVTHSGTSNVLVWLENPSWTSHNITSGIPGLFIGPIGDIDQDGDPDVAFGGQSHMGWCENLGDAANWVTIMIDTVDNFFPTPVDLADINGDGYPDLTAYTVDGFGNGIGDARWYANPYFGTIHIPEDYPSIQAGIDAAADGNTVLVADGTYLENINFKGKAITVASYYIMDGDTNHIASTIIDGSQPNHPDSGSVVYFISGEDTNSVLCGFTITGGTGTPNGQTSGAGGILCLAGASIYWNRIVNNVVEFDGPYALGGGIFANIFYTIIENNEIVGNSVQADNVWGGGMYTSGDARIVNNRVENNMLKALNGTTSGGGIGSQTNSTGAAHVLIKNNIIRGNTSQSLSSASGCYGGGLDIYYPTVELIGNRIELNTTSSIPFAHAAGFRVIFTGEESVINGNIVKDNQDVGTTSSAYAGGIAIYYCRPLVTNNIVTQNRADYGSGIYVVASSNSFVPEETRSMDGGLSPLAEKISAQRNRAEQFLAMPTMINNTIVSNHGGWGIRASNANVNVLNSILWGNLSGQINLVGSGSAEVHYSDIQGGWPGDGNIDVNPFFVDTFAYQLSDSSMCIGAGIDSINIGGIWYYAPPSDIGGNPRPTPSTCEPDIGAWESVLCGPVTGLPNQITGNVPATYSLSQSYPNPFNPSTTIAYQVPRQSDVRIEIYNTLGQKVRTLLNDRKEPGAYQAVWDGRNDGGAQLGSGVYLYRMVAGDYVKVRKMILMK